MSQVSEHLRKLGYARVEEIEVIEEDVPLPLLADLVSHGALLTTRGNSWPIRCDIFESKFAASPFLRLRRAEGKGPQLVPGRE